jgi:hypothetical protein
MHLVTPTHLPLVASVPRGTPMSEESAPGAGGTLLGTISIEVDGACPRPGDDTGGLLRYWLIRDTGIGDLG